MTKEIAKDEKQSLKRNRMKKYFLEAAKEIIMKEGVENVSVRKVANLAGYSYATIYNYFADVNELLWDVKEFMIHDLIDFIQKEMQQTKYDIHGIKTLFKIYIAYYIQNPAIFKFFYLHPLIRPNKTGDSTEKDPDFQSLWAETFKGFVTEGIIDAKDIEVIAKIFIYAMHGMLTLNISYHEEMNEESIYEDIEKIADYLLTKK
ncbi:TetR/AcrR family transcriptional regulator [Sinanaerobacter chloroacetimidivorans]|uniref:TetR/AcrR family transcriptional regulator n=1 Tax=Sinanaerobacter chloroacetimidivorans TaxID=2818044 RepID=A0A8J7W526_9FIRM|nr:TetR/AcrR family transcriptional regulator [Sinanaerobacter chloroacetimidivorans]MBR0600619.1 TetR/AcrR family transcriptional regulator [Sinanaerobacter chloroacetimidivorans]